MGTTDISAISVVGPNEPVLNDVLVPLPAGIIETSAPDQDDADTSTHR